MTTVALYCRVSTEDQAERSTIQIQQDFLRNFSKLYDLTIYQEYIDEGISGTVPLPDRPGGSQLLIDAQYQCFQAVIVYRLDRLGRSLHSMLDAYTHLETLNIVIRSATEQFDTSTAIGKFMFQFLGSLAELERSTINERMTLGRVRMTKNGKWTSGTPPFGYALDDNGHLIPSQRHVAGMTEADLVLDIFTRIAAGSSSVKEALRLNALNIPPSTDKDKTQARTPRLWRSSNIRYIIHNKVYTGTYTIQSKLGGDILCSAEAIVPMSVWHKANDQLTLNRNLPRGNQKRTYLLSGLIKCGLCNANYVGCRIADGKGWEAPYYRCGHQIHGHGGERCKAGIVRGEPLEAFIWNQCVEFIKNPQRVIALLQEKLADYAQKNHGAATRHQTLQRALLDKEQERQRIRHLFVKGHIGPEEMETSYLAVDRDIMLIRRELDEIQSSTAIGNAYTHYYDNVTTLLDSLKASIAVADEQTKKYVITRMVSGIVAHTKGRGKVELLCSFHFKTDLVAFNSTSRETVLCYKVAFSRLGHAQHTVIE